MARRAANRTPKKKQIRQYEHRDKERVNNPPVGLVTPDTDKETGKKTYAYDPHLDPALQWAGKAERTSFEVPTVSLHVHERIDPKTVIEAVRKRNGNGNGQMPLFASAAYNPPLRDAIHFYKHKHGWSNRLIAGDSLLVMNSLLEKEGLGGQVQMIYIDPPYGIKYGSNFQPFVNKRDVKDGRDEDLTQEPEMIRAFRDTWELGIHSYLTYLRDRLLLARELLTESGGVFVQISDENVHLVRNVLDEVFGASNFAGLITVRKTGGLGSGGLTAVADFILWYCKEKSRMKYRQLYLDKAESGVAGQYRYARLPDGKDIPLPEEMELPKGARVFQPTALHTMYAGVESCLYDFELDGKTFSLPANRQWSTTKPNMMRLALAGRIYTAGKTPRFVRYLDDFPVAAITTVWADVMGSDDKMYVVQTSTKVIERCLLMTTDPGDLVFDPTCGSGTTAYVAEQWGRRWITCDTSRVALALAKQRLMTAVFDYYELAHPDEGVGSGFKYKTVPHVTLKSIANNPEIKEGMSREAIDRAIAKYAEQETLYDQPSVDKSKARVTGPFTVEAVPAQVVKWVGELLPSPQPSPGGRGIESPLPEPSPVGGGSEFDLPQLSPVGRGSGLPSPSIPLPTGEGGQRPGEGKKPIDPDLLAFARDLRKEQTDAEQLLWALLRDHRVAGFKFRRQHPIEPYVLDFYCHEARFGIELDGGQHSEHEKKARDQERTAFLAQKGIRILRFWNNEVLSQTEAVLQSIYDALTQDSLTPTPSPGHWPPSPSGRGAGGEGIGADTSVARTGETLRHAEWRDELLKTGVRGKAGQRILFSRVEPLPGTRWLHAEAETRPNDRGADSVKEEESSYGKPQRAVISFGPEHAPLEQRQVALALEEANLLVPKPKIVLFAAFQFDPEAAKDIDETDWPGVTLLKVQMNTDLLTDDLKKKRASNDSFWLMGQPDVEVERIIPSPSPSPSPTGRGSGLPSPSIPLPQGEGGRRPGEGVKYRVSVHGFDYYNTKTGEIESGSANRIAMWMLDTDYDGRSLYPRQVFFPMAGEKEGWARLAKSLKAEIDEELIEAYRGTVSLPFEPGENQRIAVKIVDDRGIESLRIIEV